MYSENISHENETKTDAKPPMEEYSLVNENDDVMTNQESNGVIIEAANCLFLGGNPNPDLDFSFSLTHYDINYLQKIIDENFYVNKKFGQEYHELPIKYIELKANKLLVDYNIPYAIRCFIEGAYLCAKQEIDILYFRNILYIYLLKDNHNLSICTKTKIECFLHALHIHPQNNDKYITNITEKYLDVVKHLDLDDFCDVGKMDTKKKIKKLEDLLTYWIEKFNYKYCLPNILYLRDNRSCGYSAGYSILRREFNNNLLHYIPSKCKEDGIILLKMAYANQSIDTYFAIEFARKAVSTFYNCGSDIGLFWVVAFSRYYKMNLYRSHIFEGIDSVLLNNIELGFDLEDSRGYAVEKQTSIFYLIKGNKRIRLT